MLFGFVGVFAFALVFGHSVFCAFILLSNRLKSFDRHTRRRHQSAVARCDVSYTGVSDKGEFDNKLKRWQIHRTEQDSYMLE